MGPLCVYLHGVADPGNVGTILRSAAAFGAACVALGPATADPFSLKAVRSSMGAVFEVPLAKVDGDDLDVLPGTSIALVPGSGARLGDFDRQVGNISQATLLIGAEREGLPAEVVGRADQVAHIPIRTNSLNAAMAATIALYELANRMAR